MADHEIRDELAALIARGLPEHPLPDFDAWFAALSEQAADAARRKREQEDRLLRESDRVLEAVLAEIPRVDAQLRQVDALLVEFRDLGEFGVDGAREAERRAADLERHLAELRTLAGSATLQEAADRRKQRFERRLAGLQELLDPSRSADEVEAALAGTVDFAAPAELERVAEAVDDFQGRLEGHDGRHIPSVLRFWKTVRDRLPAAREKARRLEADLREAEERESARGDVESAVREIRSGLPYLDHLGPAEQGAQIRVWLGRLRLYQDEYELDSASLREIYLTFGAVNAARRRLDVPEYIETLNRGFVTDWRGYVEEWELRLPQARAEDEAAAREEEERTRREEARAATEEGKREAAAAKLEVIVDELRELSLAPPDSRPDPEDVRALLRDGAALYDGSSPGFPDAAAKFSKLAHGHEFRSLRRSLRKRGVPDADLPDTVPASPANANDAAMIERRPRWRGKRLALVGGLPQEVTVRRLEQGLELESIRWFEAYRSRDELDKAEATIRAGGADAVLLFVRYSSHRIGAIRDLCRQLDVPCAIVDRGCGVTAVLRGLEATG